MAKIRIYYSDTIIIGKAVLLNNLQTHYLLNVMRLDNGDQILLFNGTDGEYEASLDKIKKNQLYAKPISKTSKQELLQDIVFCFAPIKKLRMDYMIQKATEMGVVKIQPVQTAYSQYNNLNYDKMLLNAIEAAEQSERLTVPQIAQICNLEQLLANWDSDYVLLFCDERASINQLKPIKKRIETKKIAVLIGPEGGFSAQERDFLLSHDFVFAISLGNLILRADTAAVAALAYCHFLRL